MGVAWDTGDNLTYKILVDAERQHSRQPIVIRSAVATDNGENKNLQKRHIYPVGLPCESMNCIQNAGQLWKDYDLQGVRDVPKVRIEEITEEEENIDTNYDSELDEAGCTNTDDAIACQFS